MRQPRSDQDPEGRAQGLGDGQPAVSFIGLVAKDQEGYYLRINEPYDLDDVLVARVRLLLQEGIDPALEQFLGREVRATGRLSQVLVQGHVEGFLSLGSLVELVDVGPLEGRILRISDLLPPEDVGIASVVSNASAQEAAMVEELRREMRSEIAALRSELTDQRKEMNAEITRTRTEILDALKAIQADNSAFRTEVRADLDRLKESDTGRRVEISDLRGDLKTLDGRLETEIGKLRGEMRNELTDIRGDLKTLNARITTATAIVVGAVTIAGTIIGILGAIGVFS